MNLVQRIQQNPNDELILTPDGAFTLYSENKLVHSSRSPLREADKLLQNLPQDQKKCLVIAWGTGLGYHVETLLNRGYKVIAIELRNNVSRCFQQYFAMDQLEAFFDSNNIHELFDFFVQLDSLEVQTIIDLRMMGIEIPEPIFALYQQGKNFFRSLTGIKQSLLESWYYNILTNLPLLSQPKYGYTMEKIFQGQNIVICSAGPSLRKSLPYLKQHRENITILCVDTALRTLQEANITPNYVYSVDAKIHNIGDFQGLRTDFVEAISLIADISLSPQIIAQNWKEVIFVSTANPIRKNGRMELYRTELQQWLWDQKIYFVETQSGGSVATSAFHLALLYGAKSIRLVGQDLAYSLNQSHATDSPYDREYRLKCSRTQPLTTIYCRKTPFDSQLIKGINDDVYSDPLLMQFKLWFENSLAYSSLTDIYNSSEDGAWFESWKHQALSQTSSIPMQEDKIPYQLNHYSNEVLKIVFNKLAQFSWNYKEDNALYKEFFTKEILQLASDVVINKKQQKIKNKCRLYDSTNS